MVGQNLRANANGLANGAPKHLRENPYRHYMDKLGIKADGLAYKLGDDAGYVRQVYKGVEAANSGFAYKFSRLAGVTPDALHLHADVPAQAAIVEAVILALRENKQNGDDASYRRMALFLAKEVARAQFLGVQPIGNIKDSDGLAFSPSRALCGVQEMLCKEKLDGFGMTFFESSLPIAKIRQFLDDAVRRYDASLLDDALNAQTRWQQADVGMGKYSRELFGFAQALVPEDAQKLVETYARYDGDARMAFRRKPHVMHPALDAVRIASAVAFDAKGQKILGVQVCDAFMRSYGQYWKASQQLQDIERDAIGRQKVWQAFNEWRRGPLASSFLDAEANAWHISSFLQEGGVDFKRLERTTNQMKLNKG